MKPFANPYPSLSEMQQKGITSFRLVSNMPESERNRILGISSGKGSMQTIINTLWKKLADELESRNITTITQRDELESFVAECVITLPGVSRSTGAGSLSETNTPNVGGRKKSVVAKDTTVKKLTPKFPRGVNVTVGGR